ncbi:hypothetical protein [Schaalia cardiffensis]
MSLARIGRILDCSTSTIRRAVGC